MTLLNTLNPYHLPESVRKKEPLQIQREIILQFLLIVVSAWGVIGLIQYLFREGITPENLAQVMPFIVTIGIQVSLTLARRLPYRVRAIGLIILILIESFESLFRQGLSGTGMIYGIAFAAIVAVLFGPRFGFISITGFVLIQALTAWAMITGRIPLPDISVMANSGISSAWVSSILAVVLVASSIVGAFYQMTRGLTDALTDQQNLTLDLEKERDLLELRVEKRTTELTRKASQLEAARQVSAVLAQETDTKQLLTAAVDVIKEKFGFYHAGIFLNDRSNGYTLLAASTGEVGQKMLENHHRLRIGEEGIVGYVASRGDLRVTPDVLEDPNYFSNPLLPGTRAELAAPLRSGEKTIGVLDIQSTVRDAFQPDDLEVISAIANQLSLAMEKDRLMQELRNSLAELETKNRQATAHSWNIHLRGTRKHYAFKYKQAQLQTATIDGHTENFEALKKGVTIITSANKTQSGETTIAVPIKLHNQIIGVVNMQIARSKASPEFVDLVENAVNRLAISLENVRLLEELQVRAERERLVGNISSKVRAETDVESILRTAANEIGRSLGVAEVFVQLNTTK